MTTNTTSLDSTQASANLDQDQGVAFFKEVYATFEQAEPIAGDSTDRFYFIGGYTIRLRFLGPALVPLITPALEHLASPPSPVPALTVCVWDSDSSGINMPPPPWSWNDYIARGEVHGYNGGRIRTAFHTNALNMLDVDSNRAICWVRDIPELPLYERGSPLLRIFHWWLCEHGIQLVHAGAVGTADGGVLLVGKGGSGKSTTALTCIDSKLLYASDDYCLVTTNPEPYVYSIYNSGKVEAKDERRFPLLRKALSNAHGPNNEKALYFMYGHFPNKVSTGFPIRAILLPRVTGLQDTRLKKISASSGLLALAPSTIFQLPGAGNRAFKTLGDLVKQVPSYSLEAGTDLSQIPRAILSLLSEQ